MSRTLTVLVAAALAACSPGGGSDWAAFCDRTGDGGTLMTDLTGPTAATSLASLAAVAPPELDRLLERSTPPTTDRQSDPMAGLEARTSQVRVIDELVSVVAEHCSGAGQ